MFITLFNLQGTHHLSAVGFYLTTLSNLCQALFSSFLTLLCRLRFFCGLVAVATVLNFTTSFSLCQELFSSFSKLFVLSSALAVDRAYCDGFVSYHIFQLLSRTFFELFQTLSFPLRFRCGPLLTATISHLTTSSTLCQELFSTFFKILFAPSGLLRFRCLVLADSFDIIPPPSPFVK